MMNLNTQIKLPPRIRWYWLTIIILILLPFLLFFLFAFFVLAILALPVFLYLLLFYKYFTFVINENKITINSGIIIKNSQSIPFNRVQNIRNVRGILSRIFGLSKVSIWTSSPEQIKAYGGSTTHKPDGILYLITEDANWLKDFILDKNFNQ